MAIHALSEGRTLTFDDVWRDFIAFLEAFRAAAVPRRSSVVSLLGNRASFVPALLATIDHGSVLIPLDAGTAPAEVHQLVEQFGASAMIAPATTQHPWAEPIVALPAGLGLFRINATQVPDIRDAGIFKLTSGSTGRPKAIVCSEANLIADGCHIIEAMGIASHDVNMAAIPLSHSYGLGNLVMPFILQGSSLVLRESFVPARFFADLDRCGATVFPGVPFMFDYLRHHLASERMPASLRLLLTAGASIQHETVEEVRRIFGLKVHSFYGTSETGGIAYDDSEAVVDPLPVGRCLPGTSISIWPVDDGVGDGDGRVHVRSDAVAAGYAVSTEPEESAAFCDGGFLTGDLGHFDTEGQLILTGRVSQFLNVAGKKVHPDEVERVLLQMPQIAMARVVGLPCDKRGDMLVACVVPGPDQHVTATSIRSHCSTRLSSYKIPREYVFLDSLPLDQRGKTDRRKLEALVASRISRMEP